MLVLSVADCVQNCYEEEDIDSVMHAFIHMLAAPIALQVLAWVDPKARFDTIEQLLEQGRAAIYQDTVLEQCSLAQTEPANLLEFLRILEVK